METISASDLSAWLKQSGAEARPAPLLLDVREAWEFETCHLPDSVHIPMRSVIERAGEISRTRPVVCICHHGGRSAQIAQYLVSEGFEQVFNLAGGLEHWAREVDPAFPRY